MRLSLHQGQKSVALFQFGSEYYDLTSRFDFSIVPYW